MSGGKRDGATDIDDGTITPAMLSQMPSPNCSANRVRDPVLVLATDENMLHDIAVVVISADVPALRGM
jgi:alkylhydroperoxidase/carboxymuconolactone decarboxylase family protein YurZ